MTIRIMKWVLLLSCVSFIVNGIIYFATESKDEIINLIGSAGLGTLSSIWLLFAKVKAKSKS
ncbi:hypothetical protein [Paenibacillus xylaniclasticus]|uniref:hypothetical protein n=1 Tax=Paenibacillus xylaniclasticus TaxID=588083 RepID=UPI000FD6E2B2|nr:MULTISPECIES: hypothetical protein [Paenibacillus]GFN33473.1 hypothetical protein PCURB6_37330 [Paenibacillus curdlanolyticus]